MSFKTGKRMLCNFIRWYLSFVRSCVEGNERSRLRMANSAGGFEILRFQNFYTEYLVYILVICEAISGRSSVGLNWNIRSSMTKFSDFKHIVTEREFLWANHYTKIFCFCVHSGAPDLIYPGISLYKHILWMHLEKIVPTHPNFPYNARKPMSLRVIGRKCPRGQTLWSTDLALTWHRSWVWWDISKATLAYFSDF